MRIDFTNAVVEDDGYGVEVNGRSLEAIISTALGTRLGDKGGYSSGLPRFKANSCDVTVIITPHPTECTINTNNPSGNLVSVKVEKNKVTKNDRRLQTYTLNYSTGVDEIKDTLDLAIMLGIISQAGAWYKATLKDGKEQKMQGFNGVQEFYYNDLEELEYLRKQVYEAGMV